MEVLCIKFVYVMCFCAHFKRSVHDLVPSSDRIFSSTIIDCTKQVMHENARDDEFRPHVRVTVNVKLVAKFQVSAKLRTLDIPSTDIMYVFSQLLIFSYDLM